jgi:PHD/YefM family antitoxin component YafN of YafNO toxin-antitoxin module
MIPGREGTMLALKNVEYLTDDRGKKRGVVLKVTDYRRIREELEDLEDSLELEKARRDATGFRKWRDFVREVEAGKA